MNRLVRITMLSSTALFCALGSAWADTCRNDLTDARVGMIDRGSAARTDAVSSREALASLSQGGGLTFTRTVEDFWRVKVSRSTDPQELAVRYQIEGGDDRSGSAVHRDEARQEFPVRLIPIQPRILCENTTHRIISGGFTAFARVSNIGLAGLYSLEIDVDVQER